MGRDKLILGGLVILAGLGVLVVKQVKRDDSIGQPAVASKDYPSISASGDIDKVSITNGEKGEIVLEKKDGTWSLTKPLVALANQDTVTGLLANLEKLKVDDVASIKLSDETRKEKQLDEAHGVHVVAWQGADKKADEIFGKAGGAGQLVYVPSKPDHVWIAKEYQSYLYTRPANNFRVKEIFKFDDANVSQVTVQSPDGLLAFNKAGEKWTGTFKGAPIKDFDDQKVVSMVRNLAHLNADDFADGKTAADTGLDHPDATAVVTLKDGGGKYEVRIGHNAQGTSRYAMTPSNPILFTLTQWTIDPIVGGVSKFQKPVDAGVAPAAAKPAVAVAKPAPAAPKTH